MPAKSLSTSGKSYRELQGRLEEVLAKLQSPELDIDEAAQAYEEGLRLISQLEKHLQQTENNIQTVRANFGGKPSLAE